MSFTTPKQQKVYERRIYRDRENTSYMGKDYNLFEKDAGVTGPFQVVTEVTVDIASKEYREAVAASMARNDGVFDYMPHFDDNVTAKVRRWFKKERESFGLTTKLFKKYDECVALAMKEITMNLLKKCDERRSKLIRSPEPFGSKKFTDIRTMKSALLHNMLDYFELCKEHRPRQYAKFLAFEELQDSKYIREIEAARLIHCHEIDSEFIKGIKDYLYK